MLALALLAAAFAASPLVVDAHAGATAILVTADGRASEPAREADVTIVAPPQAADRVARLLPAYDSHARWQRIAARIHAVLRAYDPTQLDPDDVQFVLTVERPQPVRFAAFVRDVETRLVRARAGAQLWSIVDAAHDCAALDAAAADAARGTAERIARDLAGASGRTLGAALASADVSPARDDFALARRCDLGRPTVPARRTDLTAFTDATARGRASARVAAAFATTAGAPFQASTPLDQNQNVPPRVLAETGATRLRVDPARVGRTITVTGSSARVRVPLAVRYSWTSQPGHATAAETSAALEGAVRRLTALGIARAAIVDRVRTGPTFPVNLFADVPLRSGLTSERVIDAIAGPSAAIASAVGETFVRSDCDRPDPSDARDAYASARLRANALASAIGARVGAPLGIALGATSSVPCVAPDRFGSAAAPGRLLAGPARSASIATYTMVDVTFSLEPLASRPISARGAISDAPPPAFFASPAARTLPAVDVTTPTSIVAFDAIATARTSARRASVDLAIVPDRAHRYAPVDARRAYALVAPYEHRIGSAPTRLVLRAPARGRGRVLALHLELRRVPDAAELRNLRGLGRRAASLGATRVQIAVAGDARPAEAAALQRALASALASARVASGRLVHARDVLAVVAGEPFVDRVTHAPNLAVTTRVRAYVRVGLAPAHR